MVERGRLIGFHVNGITENRSSCCGWRNAVKFFHIENIQPFHSLVNGWWGRQASLGFHMSKITEIGPVVVAGENDRSSCCGWGIITEIKSSCGWELCEFSIRIFSAFPTSCK
ncbi:hypothetical protein AVEN_67871-1 [Araneus ventricosus]|uniref:Uncharacterized protein n=1 Tax=Araneus ventricosus TaxID=182803 RepID=A0A4Y2WKL0_ARAVE|nr:hypothetical protein AVEN_67871-1 [Araneus ventricosus]